MKGLAGDDKTSHGTGQGYTNARIVGNIISGVVLMLLASFRPLARLLHRAAGDRRRKKRMFGGLILYAWFVSLGYAAAVGVLAATADYHFFQSSYYDDRPYFVNSMTFWVLIAMLLVPSVILCTAILYLLCRYA